MVKTELEKKKKEKPKTEDPKEKQAEADDNNVAITEIYELTQRKFLKNLTLLCDKMTNIKPYPKLFAIDLIDKQKLEEIKSLNPTRKFEELKDQQLDGKNSNRPKLVKQPTIENEFSLCIRPMCEHDEGWHFSNTYLVLTELNSNFCPYLARIMNIIKNSNLANQLQIFLSEQGHKLMSDIESKASKIELSESYLELRKYFIEYF